jgi:hypothetical protein
MLFLCKWLVMKYGHYILCQAIADSLWGMRGAVRDKTEPHLSAPGTDRPRSLIGVSGAKALAFAPGILRCHPQMQSDIILPIIYQVLPSCWKSAILAAVAAIIVCFAA